MPGQQITMKRVSIDENGKRTETDVTPAGPVSGMWGGVGPSLSPSDPREVAASKMLNQGNKPMSVHGPSSSSPASSSGYTPKVGSGMPGYEDQ